MRRVAATRCGRVRGARGAAAAAIAAALALAGGCAADPGYAGRPSTAWIAQLTDGGTPYQRADAADALGHVLALQPNARPAIAALVGALADTTDVVRVAAARALTGAARGARRTRAALPGAVPGFAALLADSAHPAVRAAAAEVLGTLSPATGPAGRRALAGALRDPDAGVRRAAVGGLAAAGPPGWAAWPGLDTVLARVLRDDPDAGARAAAAAALAKLGVPQAAAVPALARAAADGAPDVRLAAVNALGAFDLAADPATAPAARAALARTVADQDPVVAREARHALVAWHRRGGADYAPREPTALERCAGSGNRAPGC